MCRIAKITIILTLLFSLSCGENKNSSTNIDQDITQTVNDNEQMVYDEDVQVSHDADIFPTVDNNQTPDTDVLSVFDEDSVPDEDVAISSCGEKHFVIVYGDTRDDLFSQSKHPEVVAAMVNEIDTLKITVEAIFNTGDLVYNGNDDAGWNDFFNEIDPLLKKGIPYYPVLGNHEYESQKFFDRFELPGNEQFYMIDVYNMRFFILDSNIALDKNSDQYKWLESELDNIPAQITFVAVLFHKPLYSTGPHGGDTALRAILHPLLLEKKVDMVFNGHDHAYERLNADGLPYFIAGGGGAPLYSASHVEDEEYSQVFKKTYHYMLLEIDKCEVVLSAKDTSNEIFDTLTFPKQLK